jgi:hypothetical protein
MTAKAGFGVDRSKTGGRRSYCKACDRRRGRAYYDAHKDDLYAQREAVREAAWQAELEALAEGTGRESRRAEATRGPSPSPEGVHALDRGTRSDSGGGRRESDAMRCWPTKRRRARCPLTCSSSAVTRSRPRADCLRELAEGRRVAPRSPSELEQKPLRSLKVL